MKNQKNDMLILEKNLLNKLNEEFHNLLGVQINSGFEQKSNDPKVESKVKPKDDGSLLSAINFAGNKQLSEELKVKDEDRKNDLKLILNQSVINNPSGSQSKQSNLNITNSNPELKTMLNLNDPLCGDDKHSNKESGAQTENNEDNLQFGLNRIEYMWNFRIDIVLNAVILKSRNVSRQKEFFNQLLNNIINKVFLALKSNFDDSLRDLEVIRSILKVFLNYDEDKICLGSELKSLLGAYLNSLLKQRLALNSLTEEDIKNAFIKMLVGASDHKYQERLLKLLNDTSSVYDFLSDIPSFTVPKFLRPLSSDQKKLESELKTKYPLLQNVDLTPIVFDLNKNSSSTEVIKKEIMQYFNLKFAFKKEYIYVIFEQLLNMSTVEQCLKFYELLLRKGNELVNVDENDDSDQIKNIFNDIANNNSFKLLVKKLNDCFVSKVNIIDLSLLDLSFSSDYGHENYDNVQSDDSQDSEWSELGGSQLMGSRQVVNQVEVDDDQINIYIGDRYYSNVSINDLKKLVKKLAIGRYYLYSMLSRIDLLLKEGPIIYGNFLDLSSYDFSGLEFNSLDFLFVNIAFRIYLESGTLESMDEFINAYSVDRNDHNNLKILISGLQKEIEGYMLNEQFSNENKLTLVQNLITNVVDEIRAEVFGDILEDRLLQNGTNQDGELEFLLQDGDGSDNNLNYNDSEILQGQSSERERFQFLDDRNKLEIVIDQSKWHEVFQGLKLISHSEKLTLARSFMFRLFEAMQKKIQSWKKDGESKIDKSDEAILLVLLERGLNNDYNNEIEEEPGENIEGSVEKANELLEKIEEVAVSSSDHQALVLKHLEENFLNNKSNPVENFLNDMPPNYSIKFERPLTEQQEKLKNDIGQSFYFLHAVNLNPILVSLSLKNLKLTDLHNYFSADVLSLLKREICNYYNDCEFAEESKNIFLVALNRIDTYYKCLEFYNELVYHYLSLTLEGGLHETSYIYIEDQGSGESNDDESDEGSDEQQQQEQQEQNMEVCNNFIQQQNLDLDNSEFNDSNVQSQQFKKNINDNIQVVDNEQLNRRDQSIDCSSQSHNQSGKREKSLSQDNKNALEVVVEESEFNDSNVQSQQFKNNISKIHQDVNVEVSVIDVSKYNNSAWDKLKKSYYDNNINPQKSNKYSYYYNDIDLELFECNSILQDDFQAKLFAAIAAANIVPAVMHANYMLKDPGLQFPNDTFLDPSNANHYVIKTKELIHKVNELNINCVAMNPQKSWIRLKEFCTSAKGKIDDSLKNQISSSQVFADWLKEADLSGLIEIQE